MAVRQFGYVPRGVQPEADTLADYAIALFERAGKVIGRVVRLFKRRRLGAVAVPVIVMPITREQVGVAWCRAERFDQGIEFDGA